MIAATFGTIAYTVCIGVLCVAVDSLHCAICVETATRRRMPMVGIICRPLIYPYTVLVSTAQFGTVTRTVCIGVLCVAIDIIQCRIITFTCGGMPMVGKIG